MDSRRLVRREIALWMALAFAVRLSAAFWWQAHLPEDQRFGFGDSDSYWSLGDAMARGAPYEYRPARAHVFRTPGYPFLLAVVFRMWGESVLAARAVSAVSGALAVGVLYWLGQRLFDRSAARVAAACAALYPGHVLLGALILSDAPFSAVMLVQLSCWSAAWRSESLRRAIGLNLATGAAAGLATWIRPSWILFTPFALAIGAALARPRRKHLLAAPLMLSAFALVMLPWWIRNARLTGHFVPTTLTVGASLYDGLSDQATGASNMEPVTARRAALRRSLTGKVTTPVQVEFEADRALLRESLAWAWRHPQRTARLAFVKLLRMWNVWPNEGQFRSWPLRLIVAGTYLPLLLLTLAGSWHFRRLGWPIALCLLPALYFSLLHMVFVSSLRYRLPALLPWMLPAAAMLVEVTRRWGWKQHSADRMDRTDKTYGSRTI